MHLPNVESARFLGLGLEVVLHYFHPILGESRTCFHIPCWETAGIRIIRKGN